MQHFTGFLKNIILLQIAIHYIDPFVGEMYARR